MGTLQSPPPSMASAPIGHTVIPMGEDNEGTAPSSITDRAHAAHQSVLDLRKRRASMVGLQLPPEEAAALLVVPPSLARLNQAARLFCVGCSYPAQSKVHLAVAWVMQISLNACMSYVMNESRLAGNMSIALQAGMSVIQLVWFMGWRHSRSHLSFDNLILNRARTVRLLQDAKRLDLAEEADSKIAAPSSTAALLLDPLLVNTVAALFTLTGTFTGAHALVFHLSFFILEFTSSLTECIWPMTCKLHALQVKLYHDTLEMAFSDLAKATSEEARLLGLGDKLDNQEDVTVKGSRSFRNGDQRTLIERTVFFKEAWVLQMTVAFVGKPNSAERRRASERSE